IKEILPFALGLAYSSSLWIFITQFDKLLLSNILTLKNYGYFTLVAIIAAGLMHLSAPIGKAVLPRMTNLLANGQEAQMLQMYRKASQVVAIIVVSVATVIAFFGEELIYVWTGDIEAAKWAAPILFWYVLGNALLPLVMFQYYLQYAHGELKLHVIMNTIMAVVTLPTIYLVAINYGAYG